MTNEEFRALLGELPANSVMMYHGPGQPRPLEPADLGTLIRLEAVLPQPDPELLTGPPTVGREFRYQGRDWTILQVTPGTILCEDEFGAQNRWKNEWPFPGATEVE